MSWLIALSLVHFWYRGTFEVKVWPPFHWACFESQHGQQHSRVLPLSSEQAGESSSQSEPHHSQSNQAALSQSLFLVLGLFTKRGSVQRSKFSLNSWFVELLHKAGSGLRGTFLEGWLLPARYSGVVVIYLPQHPLLRVFWREVWGFQADWGGRGFDAESWFIITSVTLHNIILK